MAQSELANISAELLHGLRANITDPESRPSSGTSTQSGNGSKTAFTITQAVIKVIKTVKVGGVSQSFGTDYTVAYGAATTIVTFTVAPPNVASNVVITYDYGTTWIYPDLARTDIKLGSFPRMSVTGVDSALSELSLNVTTTRHSLMKSINVCDLNPKKVEDIISDVKNYILSNKKGFYYFNLIYPVGIGPPTTFNTIINDRGKYVETVQQSLTVRIPYVWEGTS